MNHTKRAPHVLADDFLVLGLSWRDTERYGERSDNGLHTPTPPGYSLARILYYSVKSVSKSHMHL